MSLSQLIQQSNLHSCLKNGLDALPLDSRKKITISDVRLINFSIDIDECRRQLEPNANRWDYFISYGTQDTIAYFVEVHPATTREVSRVIRKYEWLKNLLKEEMPDILKSSYKKNYYWISSNNKIRIPHHTPQYRRLNRTDIKLLDVNLSIS